MPRTRKQIIKQKLNKQLINNGLININDIINVLKSYNIHKYQINDKYIYYILKHECIKLTISSDTTTDTLIKHINMQILKNNDNSICHICYTYSCTLILCKQCFTSICEQCLYKTILYNNGLDICSFCKYTEI